jgi:hypothetical protein
MMGLPWRSLAFNPAAQPEFASGALPVIDVPLAAGVLHHDHELAGPRRLFNGNGPYSYDLSIFRHPVFATKGKIRFPPTEYLA